MKYTPVVTDTVSVGLQQRLGRFEERSQYYYNCAGRNVKLIEVSKWHVTLSSTSICVLYHVLVSHHIYPDEQMIRSLYVSSLIQACCPILTMTTGLSNAFPYKMHSFKPHQSDSDEGFLEYLQV